MFGIKMKAFNMNLVLQMAIGPYVFIIFMITQLFFIAYVFFIVPETKNRTVEEVTAQFRK